MKRPSYLFPAVVTVVSTLVIAWCVRTTLPPKQPWDAPAVMEAVDEAAKRKINVAAGQPAPALAYNPSQRYEKLFDYQLKQYAGLLGALETNLFMQVAFVLFALVVLFSREEFFEIPLIKIRLLRSWLHFIVPLALLFLWLRFGFLLDTLIKTRVYGWELFLHQAADLPTKEFVRSGAALFEDSGFMDGWFSLFREEHLIERNLVGYIIVIFPAIFGTLIGANHACLLAVAHIGNARLAKHEEASVLRALLKVLPWLMFVLLLLSHVLFYFGGPNPNWFQIVMPAIASALMFVLVFLSRGTLEEFHLSRASAGSANGPQQLAGGEQHNAVVARTISAPAGTTTLAPPHVSHE